MPEPAHRMRGSRPRWLMLTPEAWLALCVTAAIALVWSHYKVIWYDEWMEMLTDSAGSLRHVMHIQRTSPVMLDPALFHIVDHVSSVLFGRLLGTALGMRLPSLLGFLLAQASLLVFVRRVAGRAAGLLGLGLPALSGMLLYAAEARPYGLVCGLFGASLPLYQAATRSASRRSRAFALAGLVAVMCAAINLHWMGVLILVPLSVAEVVRTADRRRVDGRMLLCLCAGAAGLLFALPFRAAQARFSVHYFANATSGVSLRLPLLWYRELIFGYVTAYSMRHSLRVVLPALFVFAAALVAWQRRRRMVEMPFAEFALVLSLSLLPMVGWAASLVLHQTLAMRYVMGTGLGLAALLSIAVAPLFRIRGVPILVAVLLMLGLVANGALQIHRERVGAARTFSTMRFSPQVSAALRDAPGNAIYMANPFRYAVDVQYTPDTEIRHKLTLLYSLNQELALRGIDSDALTAENLRRFTNVPIASYEEVRRRGGRAVFIVSPDTFWDWPPEALARDGATLHEIGDAFGGKAVEATFPASATAAKP